MRPFSAGGIEVDKYSSIERKRLSGFEIAIVIGILAVVFGIMIPKFARYIHNSNVMMDVKGGQAVAETIVTDLHNGYYAESVDIPTRITNDGELGTMAKPTTLVSLPKIRCTDDETDGYWYATCNSLTGEVEVYCGGTTAFDMVYPVDRYTESRKW